MLEPGVVAAARLAATPLAAAVEVPVVGRSRQRACSLGCLLSTPPFFVQPRTNDLREHGRILLCFVCQLLGQNLGLCGKHGRKFEVARCLGKAAT
jgi:hypothetical protein